MIIIRVQVQTAILDIFLANLRNQNINSKIAKKRGKIWDEKMKNEKVEKDEKLNGKKEEKKKKEKVIKRIKRKKGKERRKVEKIIIK